MCNQSAGIDFAGDHLYNYRKLAERLRKILGTNIKLKCHPGKIKINPSRFMQQGI